MVIKIKATVHILVRVLQLKHVGPFDSNFAHTLLWVFVTWWKDRNVSIGLSVYTALQISMKMVLKIKATIYILVRALPLECLSPFDSNFAHTLLWVFPTWWKDINVWYRSFSLNDCANFNENCAKSQSHSIQSSQSPTAGMPKSVWFKFCT